MNEPSTGFELRTSFLLFFCFTLAGCSSFDLIPSDSLIQRLKGRGPVLVSSDNPYLAANLLLQQESEHSKELSGFLQTKGQPAALSVTQEFLTPARINLYYRPKISLDRAEQYDLELLQGVWVINGPSTINDQEVKNLIAASSSPDVDASISSKTKFTDRNGHLASASKTNEKIIRPQATKIKVPENNQDLIPLFNENTDQSSQKFANQKKVDEEATQVPQNSGRAEGSINIDDMISRYPSSPAETTPRGDIVHFVTSEQETLGLIASWYTKSELTLSRIARANKLAASTILSPGDQVVIPAELVKNKLRLPEEAIQDLAAKAQ